MAGPLMPRASRRDFLKASGGLAGALALRQYVHLEHALAAASPAVAAPARCVSLGPNGVITPGSDQDYARNRDFLLETGTEWVRMWADWPTLQPREDRAPAFAALDRQVDAAKADGLKVVLTSYRFPRWANGTAELTPEQDAGFELHDRVSRGGDPGRRKDLHYRFPADLTPDGPWASWIDALLERYTGRLEFVEVVNEPNLQLWPQQGPSATADPYGAGEVTSPRVVAQMFETAATLANARSGAPLLLGPATADPSGSSRVRTGYDTFTTALLDELEAIGFSPGPRFAWSQHNFADVEYDQGLDSLLGRDVNRAARTRELLTGRWAGWPAADASTPQILIPEGGARLTKIASLYDLADAAQIRARQAELIARSWQRMLGPEGEGIAMVASYLFHTDPTYDSGLCERDGTKRPAYTAWAGLRGLGAVEPLPTTPGLPAEAAEPPPPAPRPEPPPVVAPSLTAPPPATVAEGVPTHGMEPARMTATGRATAKRLRRRRRRRKRRR